MAEISVLVEGGRATAGAPLGPALGPLGVDIGKIVDEINAKTKNFAGIKVPVKVVVDAATKKFEVKVGSPPTSALIKRELGIAKGAANPKAEVAGHLTVEQAIKMAQMKLPGTTSHSLRSAVCEVVGACQSMGIMIDAKKAKRFQQMIKEGKFDEQLKVT